MHRISATVVCLVALALSACSVTGTGHYVMRPNVDTKVVTFRKVALVPSESHAQIVDAAKWQATLHGIVERELSAYGIELASAVRANEAFAAAGLTLSHGHDTRAAYTQVAKTLGVDAILVPEVTLHSNSTAVLNIGMYDYEAAVSFAIFSASQQEFVGIIEGHGKRSYSTGGVLLVGAVASGVVGYTLSQGECYDCARTTSGTTAAVVTAAGSLLAELAIDVALARPDSHWTMAIDEATKEGISHFVEAFDLKRQAPVVGTTTATPAVETNWQNANENPASGL